MAFVTLGMMGPSLLAYPLSNVGSTRPSSSSLPSPAPDRKPGEETANRSAAISAPPQRQYTRADGERLPLVLQSFAQIITDKAVPLSCAYSDFRLRQTPDAIAELVKLRDRAQALEKELDAFQAAEGYYQDEVRYLLGGENFAGDVAIASNNTLRWLGGLTGAPPQNTYEIVMNMGRLTFSPDVSKFQQRVDDAPLKIHQLRAALDHAGSSR